jgi:acyl carrier protein
MTEIITPEMENEIREMVFSYFAEECDADIESLSDQTDVIEELEGDSLMLLSLLELVRKKYRLTIELKTLGRHLMEKPANTLGQITSLTQAIIVHGNDIVNVQL